MLINVLDLEIVCPSEAWRSFEGRCYRLLTDYHNMDECRDDCVDYGGDIASVHSMAENDFITEELVRRRPKRGGERVRKHDVG